MRGNPDHGVRTGWFRTDGPGPRPVVGQLAGRACSGHRGEKEDLGSGDEGLAIPVVLSALSLDRLDALLPDELLRPVDSGIQSSDVLMVVSGSLEEVVFRCFED